MKAGMRIILLINSNKKAGTDDHSVGVRIRKRRPVICKEKGKSITDLLIILFLFL